MTVFMTEGSPLYAETQELLKRYQAASPLLTVETLNPERNPARAQAFLREMGDIRLSVVFRAGAKKKVVSVDQLAEFDFARAQMGGEPALKAFTGEQEFTAAILTVTQEKSPKVVFTKGHGERPIEGRVREGFERVVDLLKQDNCSVEEWDSLAEQKVPDGTDLVVVAGPRTGFTFPETDALKTYLAGGGTGSPPPRPRVRPGAGQPAHDLGLEPVLEAYGVRLGDDIVVDPKNALPLMGPETVVARSFRSHPVTKLLEGLPVVFPVVRSVGTVEKPPEGVTAQVLVETSPDGWGETNLADLETKVEKDDTDVRVPCRSRSLSRRGPAGRPGSSSSGTPTSPRAGGIANAANLYFVTSRGELAARARVAHLDPAEVDRAGRGHALARATSAGSRSSSSSSFRPPRSASASSSGSRGDAEGGAMSTRKLLILTGVFFALLAFVVLWERHQPTSEERAKAMKRLLDLDAKDVAGLVVERPGPAEGRALEEGRALGARGTERGGRGRASPRTASSRTSRDSTSSASRGRASTRRSTVSTRRRRRSRSR